MKALILIGGEGTRLRPLTYSVLKCMVPVLNRPFIEYQLALLKKHGIHEVILSACYLPDRVKRAVGSGKKEGIKITCVRETTPLGTAGAIKNAEEYLDDTTIIMNGDILTDMDLSAMLSSHKSSGAAVSIALHEVPDPSAYGLVLTDGSNRIQRFLEKPKDTKPAASWINAGIYIFDKKALSYIPAGKNVSVEKQTFPEMIEKGGLLSAYKSASYWLDIGSLDKYRQGNFDAMSGKFKSPFAGKKSAGGILAGDKTKVNIGAVLSAPVIIGNRCVIGKGARIEHSIIWDNVKIGDNAAIKDSIIGNKCVVGTGAELNNAVLADKTKVLAK
jgi:NDP-sugar pyrophosphorylase family protein